MSKTTDRPGAEALLASGEAALERGDFFAAVATFDELTRRHPRAVVAWCGRSAAFYGVGNLQHAHAAALRAAELAPDDPRAFLVLGPSAFALGDPVAIERCRGFINGLDRAHGIEMASFWAARLADKDLFAEAAAAFDLFAEAADAGPGISLERADLLLGARRVDDAEAALSRAEAGGAPKHRVEALRARIALTRGELAEATAAAKRALAANPEAFGAYAILAETDPAAAGAQGAALLAARIADDRLPLKNRVTGGIAVGRILEKLGDFDGAFAAFAGAKADAAKLREAGGQRYDQQKVEAAMRRELAMAPADAVPVSRADPRLVFIIGLPRSGSTLLDQILSRHSLVTSVGEGMIVRRLADKLQRNGSYDHPPEHARERLRSDYGNQADGAKVVVDKNLFNFQHIRLIADLDPAARFILTARDPMDVGLSIFRTNFMAAHPWSNRLDDIAHMVACCEVITDRWRGVFPERFFIARHEDFVADFEPNVRALLDFCDLPFEPDCLDFHEGKRAVFTQSAAQVRKPLNADGVARWRRYERHLEGFRESLEAHRNRLRAL